MKREKRPRKKIVRIPGEFNTLPLLSFDTCQEHVGESGMKQK